jgi:photosystem II stability/assembly factor-like uncharacterized protein
MVAAFSVAVPAPLPAAWTPAGPFGGSATAVAIDSSNPRNMLVGARNSLVFKSTDGGKNWRRLPFPRFFMGTVSVLLIDPARPGRYYAGLANDFSTEAGVWLSDDAGETWRRPPSLEGLSVNALAQWTKDPKRLVAGTRDGVWITDDSAETWRRISKPYNHELRGVTAVAIDPRDSSIIYAGTTHLPWKTVDEGKNWVSIHNGMIDDSDVFSIFIDPAKPDSVFASACSGIYISESAGDSWNKVRGIPGTHRRTYVIRQHPKRKNVIFAGTTLGLLQSSDQGATFRKVNDLIAHALVFDPKDPETFWIAAEGSGLWRATEGGEKTEPFIQGFVNRRVIDAVWTSDRSFLNTVQEAGGAGGIFSSEDGGTQWTLATTGQRIGERHVHLIAADPENPAVLLAAGERSLFRTADAGKIWRPTAPPGPNSYRFQSLAAVNSAGKSLFLAGTDRGLFRSADGGASWKPVQLTLARITPDVKSIHTSPRSGRVVVKTGQTLYVSNNGGETWWTLPVLIPTSTIYDIALGESPDDPVLLATSKGMLRSSDGGKTWQVIASGLEEGTVNTVAYRPGPAGGAFAAQFGRVFRSEDLGKTWAPIPDGALQESTIRKLWFHPGHSGRLLALTPDLGVFYLDLIPLAVHNK